MKHIHYLVILAGLISTACFSKVLIFTYSYNRPDFIEIQHKTFKKFMQDEYEFVVFNDAPHDAMAKKIKKTCKNLNIRCVRIPQEIHNRPYLTRWPGEDKNHPAVRNCNVVQYSLDTLGFKHDDILVLLDSDMFLVKDFSIKEYMENYDISGLNQQKDHINYLWIGIVFINMKTAPNIHTINFNCGKIDNVPVDAGGHNHYYLKDNPSLRVRYNTLQFIEELQKNIANLPLLGFGQADINFIKNAPHWMEFHCDDAFLHYRAGSNWNHESAHYHQEKTRQLNEYINTLIK